MAENSSNVRLGIGGIIFWGFIIIKVMGHLFTAWSWWWVLLPLIPFLGEAVRHFGL